MEKQILSPPFFLFEEASLDIFNDLVSVEAKIEPQDWLDDVYRVFDAGGRKLIFEVVEKTKQIWLSEVRIECIRFKEAESSFDEEFLSCLQQSYQAYLGENGSSLSYKELMRRLVEKIGTV